MYKNDSRSLHSSNTDIIGLLNDTTSIINVFNDYEIGLQPENY